MDEAEEYFLQKAEDDYDAHVNMERRRKMTEKTEDMFDDFDETPEATGAVPSPAAGASASAGKSGPAAASGTKAPAPAPAANGSTEAARRGRKPKPEPGSAEATLDMLYKATGPLAASLAGKVLQAPDTAEVDELVTLPQLKIMAGSLLAQARLLSS